ncbi:hypothetical protein BDF21DRAFT_412010 [Thamnidium elegans]|nr:hypothetical protein BDF21DRAFT_412010 [Thamnidium elegans]
MILIANLVLYANTEDKYLVFLGSIIGFIVHLILHATIKQSDSIWIQLIVSLFCTKIGFDMMKGNHDLLSRFILVLLPIFLVIYNKLDFFTTAVSTLSSLFYYVIVNYLLLAPVQKCCYSFILYLTAALSVSKVFGYLERMVDPSIKIPNNDILAQVVNSRWISTSYIIYWMIISVCLIYETRKK